MRFGALLGFGREPIIGASEGTYKRSAPGFKRRFLFASERLDVSLFWTIELLPSLSHDKMRPEVKLDWALRTP